MRTKLLMSTLVGLSTMFATYASATEQSPTDREELKQQIIDIAAANTLNPDEQLPVTRALLQPLVDQLIEQSEPMDLPTRLAGIEGAWKELWSDDREPTRSGNSLNRDQVYQVVTGVGVFYNLAVSDTPFGIITTFLRGQYQSSPLADGLFITFTDINYQRGTLREDVKLPELITEVENGQVELEQFPFDPRVPNGPVGARGFLKTLYVDDTLRIAYGFNFADSKEDLYILKRTETILP